MGFEFSSQAIEYSLSSFNKTSHSNLLLILLQIGRIFAILVYSRYAINSAYPKKMRVLSIAMTLSFILAAASYIFKGNIGYSIFIIAAILLSSVSSMSECCGLSAIKFLHEEVMNAWSTGTGCSEVFGTVVYLFMFRILKWRQYIVLV